jgi:DNA-binding transcriptional ArsR family regulator
MTIKMKSSTRRVSAATFAGPAATAKVKKGLIIDVAQSGKISKALADQTRFKIFEAIAQRGEMNRGEVCVLVCVLQGLTPGTVSHRPKIFAEAGLIESRHDVNSFTTEFFGRRFALPPALLGA